MSINWLVTCDGGGRPDTTEYRSHDALKDRL